MTHSIRTHHRVTIGSNCGDVREQVADVLLGSTVGIDSRFAVSKAHTRVYWNAPVK